MDTRQFDYDLAPERIAQTPVEPRDASRLMVVHRRSGEIEHRRFGEIGDYLRAGDLLILNQTRVIRARLFGRKVPGGGRAELLLLSRRDELTWEALVRGRKLRPGTVLELQAAACPPGPVGPDGRQSVGEGSDAAGQPAASRLVAELVAETEGGGRLVRFGEPVEPWLEELGTVPLPPYIHCPLADAERYQTVYGRIEGSVAASTAGLHFTPELLVDLRRRGVEMGLITLHIGLDTFRPVKETRVEDHVIHSEWHEVTQAVAEQVNRARLEGRRVIAVGTTVVRSLESAAGRPAAPGAAGGEGGEACPWRAVAAYAGATDLFIVPGYRFRAVDAVVTNFHLPRSTLLMLVSAFAGRDLILHAYREAIRLEYRFFSFGDAMLLL